MEAHYARYEMPFNEARRTMADVPEGASLVANPISAAPGFHLGNVYAFAGVPAIFTDLVTRWPAFGRWGPVRVAAR